MINNIDSKELEKRRELIVHHDVIHGVDFVEFVDNEHLVVYLIESENQDKSPLELVLCELQCRIIKKGIEYNVGVTEVHFEQSLNGFKVTLEKAVDIDKYTTLSIRLDNANVDHFFSQASLELHDILKESEFSIQHIKKRKKGILPRLNYLAKDYQSMKALIENELNYNTPDWKERNPSDMVVMLSEVMAYSGDYLSYFQDAVATEAYLFTARQKSSIERHCRLLDYRISGQLNSRCWVHFNVKTDITIPRGTPLLCAHENSPVIITKSEYINKPPGSEVVFETMHQLEAKNELNEIEFFYWGGSASVVKKGATTFELKGTLALNKGDVLVISVNNAAEHKQAVRIKNYPVYGTDDLTKQPYTQVHIHSSDALIADCTNAIVYGNVVLVDQGQSIFYEPISLQQRNHSYCSTLNHNNLVYAERYDGNKAKLEPAAKCLHRSPYRTEPKLYMFETISSEQPNNIDEKFEYNTEKWRTVPDFLNSTPYSKDISVEQNESGISIRFGNGTFGALPSLSRKFFVRYRVTTNHKEKVAAGTINQVCWPGQADSIQKVINVTTASGGEPGECREMTLKLAPEKHRQRLNMALPQDYVNKLKSYTEIKDVYFEYGWNGTKMIFNLYIYPATQITERELGVFSESLAASKVIGHRFNLKFFMPILVHIKLSVSVEKNTNHNELLTLLRQRLGQNTTKQSEYGLLNANNFTFTTALFKSEVVQAAISVVGVSSVEIQSFQRFDEYIGNNNECKVCESIEPQGPEIIAFEDVNRHSLIELTINDDLGGNYVR